MAVTLRLARRGQTKRPFYRIVATNVQSCRDGKFLEIVGTYNTMVEPHAISLNQEAVNKWLSNGATYTEVVGNIIKKTMPGTLEALTSARTSKIQAARKARKLRLAK